MLQLSCIQVYTPCKELLMGTPRTLHSSHRRPRLSGAGETRLKSSICLIALLALIVVPLAHQHHLHSLEGFSPPPALGVEIPGDLQLSSPKPEDPDHHHHNAVTCPICQAALSSRY